MEKLPTFTSALKIAANKREREGAGSILVRYTVRATGLQAYAVLPYATGDAIGAEIMRTPGSRIVGIIRPRQTPAQKKVLRLFNF